jgi:hypothetical protein
MSQRAHRTDATFPLMSASRISRTDVFDPQNGQVAKFVPVAMPTPLFQVRRRWVRFRADPSNACGFPSTADRRASANGKTNVEH